MIELKQYELSLYKDVATNQYSGAFMHIVRFIRIRIQAFFSGNGANPEFRALQYCTLHNSCSSNPEKEVGVCGQRKRYKNVEIIQRERAYAR